MSIRHILPTPWLRIQCSPLSYWWKDYLMVLGLICNFNLWLAKSGSKMSYILLFENMCSNSFLQILLFYPVLPTPKFKQVLFRVSYSKNPKNLKTYFSGRLLFDMPVSRLCHPLPVNYSTETYRLSIRVLNTLLVLNMLGFWIHHSFKYVMVTQGSKYVWICLNNSWVFQIIAACVKICLTVYFQKQPLEVFYRRRCP